jgi:hypothetical protein
VVTSAEPTEAAKLSRTSGWRPLPRSSVAKIFFWLRALCALCRKPVAKLLHKEMLLVISGFCVRTRATLFDIDVVTYRDAKATNDVATLTKADLNDLF